jgi:hypothetical protein
MSDQDDPQNDPQDDPGQLAKKYLDLWQQQATAFTNNPDIAAAMANLFDGITQGPNPGNTARNTSGKSEAERRTQGDDGTAAKNDPKAPDSGGSASPAVAPDAGGDRLDELLRGLARLEERLEVIERKLDQAPERKHD